MLRRVLLYIRSISRHLHGPRVSSHVRGRTDRTLLRLSMVWPGVLVECRRRMPLPHAGPGLVHVCGQRRKSSSFCSCDWVVHGHTLTALVARTHTPWFCLPQGTCLTDPLCYDAGYCSDASDDLGNKSQNLPADCLEACVNAGYDYCDYEASTGACYGGATCGALVPAAGWASFAVNSGTCLSP